MVKHKVFGEERDLDIPTDVFPTETQINEFEEKFPGCEHGWFDSSDASSSKLHYRKWLPDSEIKGIVVWLPGIQNHSGNGFILEDGRKFNMPLLVDSLVKKGGYALYGLDQLGHGYSEGIRFFVPDWKTNRDDSIAFVKLVSSLHKDDSSTIPLFLSGISYGGNLTLHVAKYFQDHPDEQPPCLDSMVLLAPGIINADLPPYPVYATLRYVLAPMFPTWTPSFMPHPVSPERCWRDPEARRLNVDNPQGQMLITGGGKPFRLGTAVNLLLALEEVKDKVIPGLTIPFLCIHGDEDYAVPIKGSEYLMEHSSTTDNEKEFKIMKGGYHDLLCDPLAQETVDTMLEWMAQRITKLNNNDNNN